MFGSLSSQDPTSLLTNSHFPPERENAQQLEHLRDLAQSQTVLNGKRFGSELSVGSGRTEEALLVLINTPAHISSHVAPCTCLPGPPRDLGCRIDDEVRRKKEPLLPRPRAKLHPRRVIISSGCSSGRHSATIPEGSSSACLSAAATGQAAQTLRPVGPRLTLWCIFFFF